MCFNTWFLSFLRFAFLRFAKALAADFRDEQEKETVNPFPWLGVVQGPNGWYNFTIDAFLEQMCCWATETSAMTDQPMGPEQPSWKSFAEMLIMSKGYE